MKPSKRSQSFVKDLLLFLIISIGGTHAFLAPSSLRINNAVSIVLRHAVKDGRYAKSAERAPQQVIDSPYNHGLESLSGRMTNNSTDFNDLFFAHDDKSAAILEVEAVFAATPPPSVVIRPFTKASTKVVQNASSKAVHEESTKKTSFQANNKTKSPLKKKKETPNSKPPTNAKQEEATPLSEVDARVLNSILADTKLDSTMEENLKKLLERGTSAKSNSRRTVEDTRKQEETTKFSSSFFKAASKLDDSFWNSFRAKANDILESARIFVLNRVERDTQLLASIGLYATERARYDVNRLLPSQKKKVRTRMIQSVRNALFSLTNKRSDNTLKQGKNQFLLGPTAPPPDFENLIDELNTPMDEIRIVTESIRDILSGKGSPSIQKSIGTRRLKSISPAGASYNAERQRRAYERRKETVLKREKEWVDKKIIRAAGTVTDAAWEIQREMKVEGNNPGYRSEGVRRALKQGVTAALLAAETRGWGQLPQMIGKRLFRGRGEGEVTHLIMGNVSIEAENKDSGLRDLSMEDLSEERARLAASLRLCLEEPDRTWLVSILNLDKDNDYDIPITDDDALRDVITSMVFARDDLEASLASVVAKDLKFRPNKIIKELLHLKATVNNIADLAKAAAGYDASERLRAELLGQSDTTELSLLASLDNIIMGMNAAAAAADAPKPKERTRPFKKGWGMFDEPRFVNGILITDAEKERSAAWVAQSTPHYVETVDYNGMEDENTIAKVTNVAADVIPETTSLQVSSDATAASMKAAFVVDTEDAEYTKEYHRVTTSEISQNDDLSLDSVVHATTVELVTNDELNENVMKAKNAKSFGKMNDDTAMDDDSEIGDNVLVTISLRALDIIFFVAEKVLTVGLPSMFTAWKTMSTRFTRAQRNGMGKDGWERLENVYSGKKRY